MFGDLKARLVGIASRSGEALVLRRTLVAGVHTLVWLQRVSNGRANHRPWSFYLNDDGLAL
jgi:hypothetical protein